MWSNLWFYKLIVMFGVVGCNPVSKDFNDSIRSYSVKEEDAILNTTAKTLQQGEYTRYAGFAPSTNPIRFKDIPDNAISGSHYSRGLLHHDHDHGGYGLHDVDENHYGYGYDYDHHGYDHHGYDHHDYDHHGHDHHGYDHHHVSHHGPHHGHGHHHHKHLSHHALAAKTILWPLAGLAILGTAAALVTNPVLLQLGVISGRRRRDTTEEMKSDFSFNLWDNDDEIELEDLEDENKKNSVVLNKPTLLRGPKRRVHKSVKEHLLRKAYPIQSAIESATVDSSENNDFAEDKFVQIPLKVKNSINVE